MEKTPTRAKVPRRHPWPQWFRRAKFVLYRGRDYTGMSHAFAQSVRNMAARPRYRLRVSILIQEDPERIEVEIRGKLGAAPCRK